MTPERLALEILSVSHEIHPDYSHNQHLAWAMGFLAKYVLEKNHMDNIVFAKLNHELNTLTERKQYIENGYKQAQAKRR